MKNFKTDNLLINNINEIKASIMILETNKKEGEEFLLYSYKINNYSNELINLKGVILASVGISNGVLGEEYEIMIVEDIKEKYKIIESKNLKRVGSVPEADVINQSHSNQNYMSKFKICSRNYLKNFIVSVILPSSCPDNCLKYVCNEMIENLSAFFEDFENEENRRANVTIIDKFCEVLIYNTLIYTIPLEKEDINSSSLSFPTICNSTFSYNNLFPILNIQPPLSDSIRSEIIEIVNTFKSDRSMIQETLTLMDPPFYLRGLVLCYRNFIVYNSLSNSEYENLFRFGQLYNLHNRNLSSSEVLICESININNNVYFIEVDNSTEINQEVNKPKQIQANSKNKKNIIGTILAQREFTLYCYLDILNTKMNSSFDPFYFKRAEDLLIGLLKKSFNVTIGKELSAFSIKGKESTQERKSSNLTSLTNMPNSKIKGLFDHENKVNVIHYSIYNDTEKVIHTSDISVDSHTLQQIYRQIYISYAKIQSNINNLQQRSKNLKIKTSLGLNSLSESYANTLKLDQKIRSKLIKDNFLQQLSNIKYNEYGVKLKVKDSCIWVCCKIYEHQGDFESIEEFSNFKIIFLAYESESMLDMDNFCQDLLINENLI